MAELSQIPPPTALPNSRGLREAIGKLKREYIDSAMDKGESWTTKVLNGEQGVRLDDIPKLLDILDKKIVGKEKVCVDRETAHAQDILFRRFAATHSLLFEDSE
jgi:hypothetical protein